jgi:hypothetical protein
MGVGKEFHPSLVLHGGQHIGGKTIKIGRDPDFAAKRARASGRSFRLTRRSRLAEHPMNPDRNRNRKS